MTAKTSDHPTFDTRKGGVSSSIDFGSIRDLNIYVFIILVACIIYAKSVVYMYTYTDDVGLVLLNQNILSNLANIPKLFTTDVFITFTNAEVFYRPFLNLLFMLEMQVSKDSLVVFHVTNILLHIGCSILLYVVFKQLNLSKAIAAAAALLFCAHPLNTSAVVWIPGRNDTLMTLLVLASFSMLLQALDTKRPWLMVGHMMFFFLALLTKETAVALPILSLTYIFFVRRGPLPRRTILSVLASYLLLVAVWLFLRTLVSRSYEVRESLVAFATTWLSNSPGFILYIGKVLFPFNLSIFPNLSDQSYLLGTLSLLFFVIAYILQRPTSNRQLLWGLGWFFLFLAPTFLSIPVFYEHRAYCSFVGLLVAVAQFPLVQKVDLAKPVHLLGFVTVLALFGILAMIHSEHFRNRTAYATSAFLSSPSADESYFVLAGMYLDEGNYDASERILQTAIARKPTMKYVHRLLGDLYARRHEYALAANEYETSLRLEPLQLYTYINYGNMCLEAGRFEDAARLWKRSVFLDPDFFPGYERLANFYAYARNDPDSAMVYVRQIQLRGVPVMPELLRAIQENPLYGKSIH